MPDRLPDLFASVVGDMVWGIAVETGAEIGGEVIMATADDDRRLRVVLAEPLLGGDPATVLANARYWELPPAFVNAFQAVDRSPARTRTSPVRRIGQRVACPPVPAVAIVAARIRPTACSSGRASRSSRPTITIRVSLLGGNDSYRALQYELDQRGDPALSDAEISTWLRATWMPAMAIEIDGAPVTAR